MVARPAAFGTSPVSISITIAMCIAIVKVVGADLRQVHVLRRMNGRPAADDAAKQLDRPVGEHLVDVDIGFQTGAGLPTVRGK